MDPISIAASAVSFTTFAFQVAKCIYSVQRCFKEIKYAPKLIKKIYHELKLFESIARQLSTLDASRISDEAAQGFTHAIRQCIHIMHSLYEVLGKYDFEMNECGPKKLWKQIVAADKKQEFEEYLRTLERTKSSLNVSMAGIQLQLTEVHSKHIERSLDRIQTSISSLSSISNLTYTNTIYIKQGMEDVTQIIKSVDQSIQDLRSDMGSLVEESMQRVWETKFKDWMEGIKLLKAEEGGVINSGRTDSLLQYTQLDKKMPLRPTQYRQICSNSSKFGLATAESRYSPLEKTFQYLPQGVIERQAKSGTCVRRKLYCRNFTLPIGFIQTRTIQKTFRYSGSSTKEEREIIRVEISVVPFQWLSSRGHIYSIEKVYDQYNRPSWTYTPRIYNILPKNATVFSACHNRDVDMVRRLFQYQEASPFDVDSDGRSLMAFALDDALDHDSRPIINSLEVVKFLIGQGADTTPFISEFLVGYKEFSHEYFSTDSSDEFTYESDVTKILHEIWRLSLEHCQTDPFADFKVLEKLWDASLGGTYIPPLDPAYLFQEKYTGFDDLVYERPELVFADLMCGKNCWGSGSDETWRRLIDQSYETLVYVCNGGEHSIKSQIFAKSYTPGEVKKENSCFCPTTPSHLLLRLLGGTRFPIHQKSRRKPLRRHIHRVLVLLLQNGEDPEATCSCKGYWERGWQSPREDRSATALAANAGVLDVWLSALEDTGFDATRIFDEWRLEGFTKVFEIQEESVGILSKGVWWVGNTLLDTMRSVV
ncbi:uncharacterized protein BDR25DRAFT_87651 [Lindgomyces ingoldianus]|uniref:Uncharacterized protein n=1 Tax=Lindgomyces ingoldianus TaxID=673940 RepID=A0ACB6RB24_9PLEO|nr:uncharacterized protein BDR25DRAFT_87651 [Lindgomyces ingoldianus]KAF2475671.1 hypothetical protein BDR25DRAFT_87651 [Lindgomyces ingoldianus]